MGLFDDFFKFLNGNPAAQGADSQGLLQNILGGNQGVTLQSQLGRAVNQDAMPPDPLAQLNQQGVASAPMIGRQVDAPPPPPSNPIDQSQMFQAPDPLGMGQQPAQQQKTPDPQITLAPPPPKPEPPAPPPPSRGVMESFIQQLPELALSGFANIGRRPIHYNGPGQAVGLAAFRGLQGMAVPFANTLATNRIQGNKEADARAAAIALAANPNDLPTQTQFALRAPSGEVVAIQHMARENQINSVTETMAQAVEKQLMSVPGRNAEQVKAVVAAARLAALRTGDTTKLISLTEKAFDPADMAEILGNGKLAPAEVGALISRTTKDPAVAMKLFEMRHKFLSDPMEMSETKLRAAIATNYAKDPKTGAIDYTKAEEKLLQLESGRKGADTQQWNAALAQARRENAPDERVRAEAIYDEALRKKSFARGQGGQQGALDVKKTPEYQQTETDIAAAREAGKPLPAPVQTQVTAIDDILAKGRAAQSLYKPEYVGGVMGAFSEKGSTGGVRGSLREGTGTVGENEVVFRQNTADISDMILRARSGAQINNQEAEKLQRIAPQINDQPTVYAAKLKNLLTELERMKQEKIKAASTPRGVLGAIPKPPPGENAPQPQPGRNAAPKPPPAALPEPPKGKMLLRDNKTGATGFYPAGDVPAGFSRLR